ncbi:MAG: hypothetical protein HKN18_13010 [Silicimonas sp.]|nr:hypothetical protein [Silicimonas sp.]
MNEIERLKIRADIDNRTFTAVQTAAGGGIIVALASSGELIAHDHSLARWLASFVGLNCASLVSSLVANIFRRRSDLAYCKGETPKPFDWLLIYLSITFIASSYIVLVLMLWAIDN